MAGNRKKVSHQIFEFLYFLLIWKPKETREEIAREGESAKKKKEKVKQRKKYTREKKEREKRFL